MQKSTKKTIAILAGGSILGFILGRTTQSCPALPPGSSGAPDVPALQRISADLVNMCDQIRPVALQLEAALADDREISTSEAYALYRQFSRMTR